MNNSENVILAPEAKQERNKNNFRMWRSGTLRVGNEMISGWVDAGKMWVVAADPRGGYVAWHVSGTVRGKDPFDRIPIPWKRFPCVEAAYHWYLSEAHMGCDEERRRCAQAEATLPGVGEFMEELEGKGFEPVLERLWTPGKAVKP